jgi:hypothetical protein
MDNFYIYVERDDDVLLFGRVITPLVEKTNARVVIRSYRQLRNSDVKNKLVALASSGWKRLLVGDMNDSPSIPERKRKLNRIYGPLADDEILIVEKEIEGWYLAGLTEARRNEIGIARVPNDFEKIIKEVFREFIPKMFASRADFLLEILKNYSVETAMKNSGSFAYAIRKHFS